MELRFGVGRCPLSAGPHAFATVPSLPEGLHPSPGAHFALSAAQPSSMYCLSREVASPVLSSHGRPAEEEREPS